MGYRAGYWISGDGQAEMVLTTEDQAGLDDAELMTAATAEAEREGCYITTGRLVIGDWRREPGDPA